MEEPIIVDANDAMTPAQVAERVEAIRTYGYDTAETPLSMRDALYRDVLTAIAERKCVSPSILAKAALAAESID